MENRGVDSRFIAKRRWIPCIVLLCSGLIAYFLLKQEYPYSKIPPMINHNSQKFANDIAIGHSSESCENHSTGISNKDTRLEQKLLKSTQPCTFGVFRKVYARDHYFPTGGRWVNSTSENMLRYQPEACKFKYPKITETFIDRCLAKASLSSVGTIGDSTANRYFKAIYKTLGVPCEGIRHEEFGRNNLIPDKEYYTSHVATEVRKYVKIQFRFCGGCKSGQVLCKWNSKSNGSSTFTAEYIAQTMVLDDSMQITFPNYYNATRVIGKMWAITSQEYIFRYFLKDRYPQVFIIFLPFIHARHNMQLDRLGMEIKYYKSLLEYYFPNTTKFVYMPAYSDFEKDRRNGMWRARRYDGAPENSKINKMNAILYNILEPDLLRRDARVFSFLDLFEASIPRANWCSDSQHMKPVWYENVMMMFWETFCNSVMLDEF